jgi:hypothetical protein
MGPYLSEFALTDLTLVRFDARMDTGVLREIRRVGEALGARGTFVGFGVLLVNLLAMNQHVRLGGENLKQSRRCKVLRIGGFNFRCVCLFVCF